MDKSLAVIGTFFGLTAIILGAFGAHALKVKLSLEQLATFETGVKYQMYQAFFLLIISFNTYITEKIKRIVFYLVVSGVLLFSGSIYLLSTRVLTGLEVKYLGPITPIGGALIILGWTVILIHFIKKK